MVRTPAHTERALVGTVEEFHIRMCWCAVEIEIRLFDILPVIPFVARQSEQSFLENTVTAVPKRNRKADLLVTVTDSTEAVLIPSICFRARLIVWQEFPAAPDGL
jgi:hypothetical protein